MKKLVLGLLFVTTFIGCSKDNDVNPCENLPTNGTEITTAYFSSGIEYGINPTSTNCINFKAAAEAYITYGNSVKDCLDSNEKAELETELNELELELATLNCN